jgi:hypothetical protein
MAKIRNALDADWDKVWPIVQETFDSGDTYPQGKRSGGCSHHVSITEIIGIQP